MRNPAVRSIPRAGLAQNRRKAHQSRQYRKRRGTGNNGSALWQALCAAPAEGLEVSELMRITGWKRTKLYRHLREYAETGRAIQVSRGRWRAQATGEPSP